MNDEMDEKGFWRVTVIFWSHLKTKNYHYYYFRSEDAARRHVDLTIANHDVPKQQGASWKESNHMSFTSWRKGSGRPPELMRMKLRDVEALKYIRLESVTFEEDREAVDE